MITCQYHGWQITGRSRIYLKDCLIGWEDNRDCHITMPLSLKTVEVQIKGDQWNMRFRTVQVYWNYAHNCRFPTFLYQISYRSRTLGLKFWLKFRIFRILGEKKPDRTLLDVLVCMFRFSKAPFNAWHLHWQHF